jgi:putative nucleotidyltransferase with HDIG domain
MTRRPFLRRLKLRHVLLIVVLLSSLIPLLISSALVIPKSREVLEDAERDNLIRRAGALSREINAYLVAVRRQLEQVGSALLAPPGPPEVTVRLRQPWVSGYLQSVLGTSPDLLAIEVRDLAGAGPAVAPRDLPAPAATAMSLAFEQARAGKTAVYRLVSQEGRAPLAVLAVPAASAPGGANQLVVEALIAFRPLAEVFQGEPRREVGIFLLDREGRLLWEDGGDPAMAHALMGSEVVRSFVKRPMSFTKEYGFATPRGRRDMLAQVSAIPDPGWGVVVQKPLATVFAVIDQMIVSTIAATVPLVLLSLGFALLAARWMGRPIQRLAESTHEIAAGSFGGRVDLKGMSFDLADLAEDFNRMSGHLESYVQQLRQAAQANRDLFIGSLRAFAAAIDAKDPYTRGHSERVAAVSRTVARHLGLAEDVQHRVWIGALLHDVGKIGIEDTILRKESELTSSEYEQMKMHTVIGAEIMAPIEQLKEMIPAIRWHHESWNGRGYPDGLRGEQIPLVARIVAVADTFDAITTTRPYKQAIQMQIAVDTITRLTGSRFDAKIVTAFLRAVQAGDVRAADGPARPRAEVEARAAAQHGAAAAPH